MFDQYISADWNTLIVGKLSPYIDVDHEDKIQRQMSEKVLEQELSFAGHLGLPAVMLRLRKNNTNLARILHSKVLISPLNQVCIYGLNIHNIFTDSIIVLHRLVTMYGSIFLWFLVSKKLVSGSGKKRHS